MKTSHVIVLAIVLVVAGLIIMATGWNGIVNTVNNPMVVQESKTAGSVVDQMSEDHYSTPKPMNPLVVPIVELILGLIMVGYGLYVIAGNLHIMLPKTKPTPKSGH